MLAFSVPLGPALGPDPDHALQMSLGPIVPSGAGLSCSSRAATTPGDYLVQVFPAVLLFGAGLAITVAPLTATAMGAAAPEQAGVASAVNNVVARAAGLLAVAILPLLAGAHAGADALEPSVFAAGFRTAMVITAVACAGGGVAGNIFTIRNPGTRLQIPRCIGTALPRRRAARRLRGGARRLTPTPRAVYPAGRHADGSARQRERCGW